MNEFTNWGLFAVLLSTLYVGLFAGFVIGFFGDFDNIED